MERNAEEIKSFVREHYASLAQKKIQSCCTPEAAVFVHRPYSYSS